MSVLLPPRSEYRARIIPAYIGPPDGRLYACFHQPAIEPARSTAILLCYPVAHEYYPAYRAFQEIALSCAQIGFHVLRFDPCGCGDSSGEIEDGGFERWVADIKFASDELKKRTGVTSVCLVGLRMGASLACIAASRENLCDGLVLWDPVVSGSAYIKETALIHRMMLRFCHLKAPQPSPDGKAKELMGFPVTTSLFDELTSLDLIAMAAPRVERTLLLTTGEGEAPPDLVQKLHEASGAVELLNLPEPKLWTQSPNEAKLSEEALETIVSWIDRTYSQ